MNRHRCQPVLASLVAAFTLLMLTACGGGGDTAGHSVPAATEQQAEVSAEAEREAPCIDPEKTDPTIMCTMDYSPVCGCDGETYSNSCVASSAGVTRWTPGECAAQS